MSQPANELSAVVNEGWAWNLHLGVGEARTVRIVELRATTTARSRVAEGEGTLELVVTPLPAQAIDSSLFTEGTDGLRVLSTRFRTRAVKDDTRREVRAAEEQIKTLQAEAQRLQKEVAVQEQDLQYLHKLEGFTGAALTGVGVDSDTTAIARGHTLAAERGLQDRVSLIDAAADSWAKPADRVNPFNPPPGGFGAGAGP